MKLFHNKEQKVIECLDERFYSPDNGETWFPSSTTILDVYPKGFGFNDWLKSNGFNADVLLKRAGDQGSRVHDATQRSHEGEVLLFDPDNPYTIDEIRMIHRYGEFWEKHKPEVIAIELSLCSAELGYGGTIDRVLKIKDKIVLIDLKTSNYIHKSHYMQIASYVKLWDHFNPEYKIDVAGVLWLKAQTRTEQEGKIQGKGWQFKKCEDVEAMYSLFRHTFTIWKEENPNAKPKNIEYADRIDLSDKKQKNEDQD